MIVERPTEQMDEVSKSRGGRSNAGFWLWMRDLCVIAFAAVVLFVLYKPVRVDGTSMLPVLEDQDRLFVNQMALWRGGKIHRGNVVVFHYPRDPRKSYIKRVIGLPGDRIRIDHGAVVLNGVELKEPYVPAKFSDDRSQPEMIVPEHEFFLMGDHRLVSLDSRTFGPVDRDLIYGRAAFVYWPMEQAGVVR